MKKIEFIEFLRTHKAYKRYTKMLIDGDMGFFLDRVDPTLYIAGAFSWGRKKGMKYKYWQDLNYKWLKYLEE